MRPLMLLVWLMVFGFCCCSTGDSRGKGAADGSGGTDTSTNSHDAAHNGVDTDATTGMGLDARVGEDANSGTRSDSGVTADANSAPDSDTGVNVDANSGADTATPTAPHTDSGPDAAADAGFSDAPIERDAGDIPGPVQRPSYNTGAGFFVLNGRLYDANGVEFRIRGVNKCHYDAEWPGIPRTHANTIRWSTPLWREPNLLAALMQDSIDADIVPMPAVWYTDASYGDSGNVTCKEDVAIFNVAIDQWIAHADTFKPFERYILVNIANEWGPANSTVWRDAYIDAVARLRGAGYLSTLVIDAGGCGQDPDDITQYAQAIWETDPQRNIVFDVHIYGMWADGDAESWQTDLDTGLDRLANSGLPIVIGEFGPGRNIGPSPTMIAPGRVIQACEERGFGWLAWAWDDPAYNASDDWFAMSYNGDYNSSADLTAFGKDVVENPTYGLLALGNPATVF